MRKFLMLFLMLCRTERMLNTRYACPLARLSDFLAGFGMERDKPKPRLSKCASSWTPSCELWVRLRIENCELQVAWQDLWYPFNFKLALRRADKCPSPSWTHAKCSVCVAKPAQGGALLNSFWVAWLALPSLQEVTVDNACALNWSS